MGNIVISDILRGIKSVDEVNLILVDDEKNVYLNVSPCTCVDGSLECVHTRVCACV